MGHGAAPYSIFQTQGRIFLELESGQERAEDKGGGGDGKKVCLPSFLCSAQESHWKGEEGNLEP